MLKTKDLFDLSHTRAKELLEKTEYPWEALKDIKELILTLGPQLPKEEFEEVSESSPTDKLPHASPVRPWSSRCSIVQHRGLPHELHGRQSQ